MNDFLFFILTDGSIRKLPIEDDTLREIVLLWVVSRTDFISDEITEIVFNGEYKPNNDEVLYVTKELPENFANIPMNTLGYDDVVIPGDKIKTVCLYHDGDYYFQNFLNHYILKNRNIPIFFSDETYKKFDNNKAFTIEEAVHAMYHNGKFYFRSYLSAKQIFDLSDFYTEATDIDIDDVFSDDMFAGTDCEWLKKHSDSVMRKQIKSIKMSGVLERLDVTSKVFKSWANKAKLPSGSYNTGHLIFPKNKRECKIMLSFLNEDIYEGHFSKSIFVSNSKRKAKE